MKKSGSKKSDAEKVIEYMDALEHPFKSEVEVVRAIIKNAHPEITEQIKWNAPSFSYKGSYIVTFNLHAKQHVHLVFHNPEIVNVESELLEGDYPTRRMTYFVDMNDVEIKKAELERVLQTVIELVEVAA